MQKKRKHICILSSGWEFPAHFPPPHLTTTPEKQDQRLVADIFLNLQNVVFGFDTISLDQRRWATFPDLNYRALWWEMPKKPASLSPISTRINIYKKIRQFYTLYLTTHSVQKSNGCQVGIIVHCIPFGTCTIVSLNRTLVEDKMRRFKGECAHFSFSKFPI
jgi:hypothetical protein